jgi:hypothetical protein
VCRGLPGAWLKGRAQNKPAKLKQARSECVARGNNKARSECVVRGNNKAHSERVVRGNNKAHSERLAL